MRTSLLLLLVGCSAPVSLIESVDAGGPRGSDAGAVDASVMDAGSLDAGPGDSGVVVPDAGVAIDAGSPCTVTGTTLSCEHRTLRLSVARPFPLERVVHVGLPTGAPPTRGWPVAILFQGSLFSAALTWSAGPSDPLGAFWQTRTVQQLLDSGFAVVTPEARLGGSTYWDTNVPQWSLFWDQAPDHHLMLALFDALQAGTFGPLDPGRLYAAGISSGGYMTSRMALSYPGRFKALAIHSASWATCGGALCALPANLPSDHPPTLFVHGELDLVVPISTMRTYERQLQAQGFEVRAVTSADKAHEWLEVANPAIRDFFLMHP